MEKKLYRVVLAQSPHNAKEAFGYANSFPPFPSSTSHPCFALLCSSRAAAFQRSAAPRVALLLHRKISLIRQPRPVLGPDDYQTPFQVHTPYLRQSSLYGLVRSEQHDFPFSPVLPETGAGPQLYGYCVSLQKLTRKESMSAAVISKSRGASLAVG